MKTGRDDTMSDWQPHTLRAKEWFESLRDQICAAFEAIEREAGSTARFTYTPWDREEEGNERPGGGVQGLMKGAVFEKVGVNVSTVGGNFPKEFAANINGADEDNPGFTATGISLVAHLANPHAPAVHMNTRFLTPGKAWNGDEYFYLPHREVHRGVGGIFYDHLESDEDDAWERNFAFTQDVGKAFLDIYPKLVRKRMNSAFTPEDEATQLEYRGRYAEFNLVYDRGTIFGLKTGGNIAAILMSLPPKATWS